MKKLVVILSVLVIVASSGIAVAGEKEDLALRLYLETESARIKIKEAKQAQQRVEKLQKRLKELLDKQEAPKKTGKSEIKNEGR